VSSRAAAADHRSLVASNEATIEAWNGVLFDRFLRFRLAGSQAERRHSSIVAALDAALAELQEPDRTVRAPASTWIIGARSPRA
jgi:hypothetical protein